MNEVARHAGVSQATVSVVMNDRRDIAVAETTRARVLSSARELGFRPNRLAQSLRRNRSDMIGVVTDGIVASYAGLIIQGLQDKLRSYEMICVATEISGDAQIGDQAVTDFLDHGVTAVVYVSPSPKPVRVSKLLDETRTLFINCWPKRQPREESTVVLADEYGGGLAAAAAVFAQGHRSVTYIAGPRSEYACVERLRGLRDAARAAHVSSRSLTVLHGDYSIVTGYELTQQICEQRVPSAILCGNDRMAVGALLALHERGLTVPHDLSVVGFDDQPDLANEVRPALTSVSLPHYQMGVRAAELIMQDELAPGTEVLPCPVVVRQSLAPPRGAAT